jgi:hypothetical protein
MPKTKEVESVLHDWVHTLTFQQQALLMTGMRGPDGMPKHCEAKVIVRYLRGAVIKPAGNWSGLNDNDFMWGDYTGDRFDVATDLFFDDHDQYPHHFIMHLIHCAQVVGYKHPDKTVSFFFLKFYVTACDSFHMEPETEEEMEKRLNDFK